MWHAFWRVPIIASSTKVLSTSRVSIVKKYPGHSAEVYDPLFFQKTDPAVDEHVQLYSYHLRVSFN